MMPLHERTVDEIYEKPTASVNMEFSNNSERQCLTTRLAMDLICLQLPENSQISWDSSDHWELIQSFPLFGHYRPGEMVHITIGAVVCEKRAFWDSTVG